MTPTNETLKSAPFAYVDRIDRIERLNRSMETLKFKVYVVCLLTGLMVGLALGLVYATKTVPSGFLPLFGLVSALNFALLVECGYKEWFGGGK